MRNDRKSEFACGCLAFSCLLLISGVASGQSRTGSTELTNTADREKQNPTFSTPTTQPRGPALESTISPESYYVGPSDVFSVNVWTSPPLAFQLTVTPEGTLIVPTVGEVAVSDMTLAAAKKKVLAEIRKKYLAGQPTVTLVNPRPIVISVRGQVLNPGSYVMAAYNRVERALEEANRLQLGQKQEDLDAIRRKMSTRRITVRHNDGTQSRADIQKFLTTKDDRWNPYLREGDIIAVPPNDFAKNVIGVYGEMNSPGKYEFAEGDSVHDALLMALGFSIAAQEDSVEFTRQNIEGETSDRKILDGRKLLGGLGGDFPLQPGDRLLVHGKVDHRGDYRVKVTGEVLFPGTYPITRNSTHLADVIHAAGGFTQFASLTSAEVFRQPVTVAERDLERRLSLRGGIPIDDTLYYYQETELRIRQEKVDTDFERLFLRGDSTQNIILQDDDVVDVPSVRKTVYVFGQVVSPGHVPFSPRQDVKYYLARAGGTTDRARTGDVKVIKARTRQWLSPDDTQIEEGDFIWIPREPDRQIWFYLGVAAESAAILSAATSLLILAVQLRK